ncbi:MAG: PQQ-binding-like beta-propeller repeat protein [Gammaproteobacteria bacterium]|nr:PQQ-binding-like beta-propeller repeat protein [Gammaproteobacteria bacterium]
MKVMINKFHAVIGALVLASVVALGAFLWNHLADFSGKRGQAPNPNIASTKAPSAATSAVTWGAFELKQSKPTDYASIPAKDLLKLEMGQWRFDPQQGFPDRVLATANHVIVTFDANAEHHAIGRIYALDPETGKVQWHYRFDYPSTDNDNSIYSEPVTATYSPVNHILVIGTHDTVLALDDDSGALKWRKTVNGTVSSLAILASPNFSDYAIYAGTTNGRVYKLIGLGASRGKSANYAGYVTVPGRVAMLLMTQPNAPNPDLFVATEKPTTLERLSLSNVQERWKVTPRRYVKSKNNWYPVRGMAVAETNRLYVAIYQTLLALDPSNGALLWKRPVVSGVWWDSPSPHIVVGPNSTLYALSGLYSVAARNADGKLLWTASIPQDKDGDQGWLTAIAVGPKATLFAGTSTGRIYAFSRTTHSLEWEFDSPETVIRLLPLGHGSVAATTQIIPDAEMNPQGGASVIAIGSRNAYAQAHLPRADRLSLYSAMLADDFAWNDRDLAGDVISMAQKINPRPTVPSQAYEKLGEAQEDLREGNCDSNADALNAVRELVPWWGQLYKAMADAYASSKCGPDPADAVTTMKLYLQATPQAPDRDQIEEKIGALNAEVANARLQVPVAAVAAQPAAQPAVQAATPAQAQPVQLLAVSQGVVTGAPDFTGVIASINSRASCAQLLHDMQEGDALAMMFAGEEESLKEVQSQACPSGTDTYTKITLTNGTSYAVTATDAIQTAQSWQPDDQIQVYDDHNTAYCASVDDGVLVNVTRNAWLCISY